MSKTDITRYYDVGDVIYAKVLNVAKSRSITLTMNDYRAKKLTGGMTLNITPSKVPRLIGRQGSMIELIKKNTGCQIVVGQNGVVWVKGENTAKAIEVIRIIENDAHTVGLTDKITKFLGAEPMQISEEVINDNNQETTEVTNEEENTGEDVNE